MGINRDNILWWKIIRKRYFKSSHHNYHHKNSNSSIIVLHTNEGRFSSEELNSTADTAHEGFEFLQSREDVAAITIQACFRSHLAGRAFRALKSLVKLQALARGVIVRRQACIALCCMNALTRLQITVRSRQLLQTQH